MVYISKIDILIYVGVFFALYFSIFVALVAFENKKRVYLKPKKQIFPFVSLLVPCYNEAENIDMVAESLIGLNYPKNRLEIIFINDGSTDQSEQKALAWQIKYPSVINVFSKPNGGKHTALNLGAEKAKGEIIGCVDGDCYVEKDSVLKMVNYFSNKETDIVVSTIKILNPKSILEGIQCVEYIVSAFFKKVFGFLGSISVTSGPLTLFRASSLKTLGPYRKAHQTEDLEIAFRAQKQNMKIDYALDAIVFTKGEKTIKGLTRQRLRWRKGFLLNLKDYPCLLDIKKHGNLSFCLGYNLIGVALAIGLTAYSLYQLFNYGYAKISQLALIRFDISVLLANIQLAWPTINLKPAFVFSVLCVLSMLIFIFWGKKLTLDKTAFKKKVVFYSLFYAFFNALWWLMAGWLAIFKKEMVWQ